MRACGRNFQSFRGRKLSIQMFWFGRSDIVLVIVLVLEISLGRVRARIVGFCRTAESHSAPRLVSHSFDPARNAPAAPRVTTFGSIPAWVRRRAFQTGPIKSCNAVSPHSNSAPNRRISGSSERPGLGIELNEEAVPDHSHKPYDRAIIIQRDGAIGLE